MLSRKLKTIILISSIFFSLFIMLSFLINNFINNGNVNYNASDYDVKVQDMDNTNENLPAKMVINAIDIKQLNKTIAINLDPNRMLDISNEPQLIYKVQFNKKLFQYLFLKLIIKTFPQWKNNNFVFHFNKLNNAVWVQYNTNVKIDYLSWYFKIVSKI